MSIWQRLHGAILSSAGRRRRSPIRGSIVLEVLEERRPLTAVSALDQYEISTTGSDATIHVAAETVDDDASIAPATSLSGPLIELDDFRSDSRLSGIDGSGMAAVILDTGIDLDHAFFGPDADADGVADRIVYQYDLADGDADASDRNGHGSNVSSIVGSEDTTYTGVAPGVDLIHLKVFSDSGEGEFRDVEAALQWVLANIETYNIVSVNMSLGDESNYSTPRTLYGIGDELAALAAEDVIVVSASGNDFFPFDSEQGVSYPAADPNALSIGAVYDTSLSSVTYGSGARATSAVPDAIAPFSQRHETLTTAFAPGAPITGANFRGGTVTMHGTSQAAPHVTGMAVLAQQLAVERLGRRLTVSEFTDLLRDTGETIQDGDDENDNVTNTNLSFPRVDMFALAEEVLAMAGEDPVLGISGTAGADTFVITPGSVAAGTDHIVEINDTVETFDPAVVEEIVIDGGGGEDRIAIHGTIGNESVTIWSGAVDVVGETYAVYVTNVAEIAVDAGDGGDDDVSMTGGSGSNRLYVEADSTLLTNSTGTFRERADGFDEVTVQAPDSERSYAFLHAETGSATLHATPDEVTLGNSDSVAVTASGFERVYAYASGGDDSAVLTGSETLANRFYSNAEYSVLTETRRSFYVYASGFQTVTANSPGNVTSYAYLYDGPGDDTLTASPASATIGRSGTSADATADGFERVYAQATRGGTDSAQLVGSAAGGNRYYGYSTHSTLTDTSRSFYHYIRGFRSVTAIGSQTDPSGDRAYLHDSLAADTLFGRGNQVALGDTAGSDYRNEAWYFDLVYARSSDSDETGDSVDVDDSLAYNLVRRGTWT